MDFSHPSSLAAFLLVNRLDKEGPAPLTVGEFWQVQGAVGDPAPLMGRSNAEIAEETGAPPDVAERIELLLGQGRGAALALEELSQSGIKAMTVFDDVYPDALRSQLKAAAPPLLYFAGDPSLLSRPSLAIVGARHVGEEELSITRAAASAAVAHDLGVTSGGARGVDQVAMATAFAEGGSVVGVLADSLLKSLKEPETRRAILDGRALFLTHQNPGAGFNVGAAMGRNKIIYALADVTFVVSAAVKSGGTWTGADEALRRGYGRVAVWMGEGRGPGNKLLVEQGGHPTLDVEELFSLPPPAPADVDQYEADQLRLGL